MTADKNPYADFKGPDEEQAEAMRRIVEKQNLAGATERLIADGRRPESPAWNAHMRADIRLVATRDCLALMAKRTRDYPEIPLDRDLLVKEIEHLHRNVAHAMAALTEIRAGQGIPEPGE